MKRRLFYLIAVFVPLLVWSCGGEDLPDLIPPPPTPGEQGGQGGQGGGEGGGGGTDTHPWDANRGKEVYPSGAGWTVTKIEDGITYYAFSGTDPVSKSPQRVFVTDIDLTNTNYSVKLAYYDSRSTASAVMKDKKAIVTMNAGYERESIVIKVDGLTKYVMPNGTIGSTGVTNWKNEGCVIMDGRRDVRFEYTGKGLSYQEQQKAYLTLTKDTKNQNVISSAPQLIYDYEPVGETFITRYPKKTSNSEDPYVHQSTNTHPRTVIARNEFNHLQLIVIDGRRSSVSRGMSAKEVTQFLVANFNPQYALNMDGGGSSTMCVQGQGDPSTHVVNYPTDSDQVSGVPDHSGERSVPTFFYVVKN